MSKRKSKLTKQNLPLPKPITPILPIGTPPPKIEKRAKFKQPGHYVDQKLKHNFDREKRQLSLFDELSPVTKDLIKNEEVIVEGIKLGVREEKLLNGILKLYQDRSDKEHNGNLPSKRVTYGGQATAAPQIRIKPTELYTEFSGNKAYSGNEAKLARETLLELQDKKFLIVYKRHRKNSKGETVIDRIEEFRPLLRVITYYEGLTIAEDAKIDKGEKSLSNNKGDIIIALSPLFKDQIDTKFIEYPIDINKQTQIAAGGARKVHTAITNLRDYLLRAIASNKKKGVLFTLLDAEKLPHVLGLEKYVRQSRKKLIQKRINEAIETSKALGILIEAKELTGKKGQSQYKFILNLDY